MKTLVDLRIEPLGPDSDRIPASVRVGQAVVAHDSPWATPATEHRLRSMLRAGWDGEPPEAVSALVDGEVVGGAELWTSDYDNLTSAWFSAGVHPAHRRHGIGTELLRWLSERALALGRPLVGFDAWDIEPAREFARAHGFESRSAGIQRRLRLADVPPGLAEQVPVVQAQHAPDYELLRVPVPVPEEFLPGLTRVFGDINDAPTDDLEVEDEVFSPERVRSYERAQLERGDRLYQVLARHRSTGELAGHTIVAVDGERPQLGDQHNTAVVRAHRGHRLGWLLKAEMLCWLVEVEPQLVRIDTYNAESNSHMIAVNEELGYRVAGRSVSFQKTLPTG